MEMSAKMLFIIVTNMLGPLIADNIM